MAADGRRKKLERAWIATGLVYAGCRILIANATVKRYGVNIWAFAAIELGSSFPYSLGTARLVGSLVDRDQAKAFRWGALAAVCFLLPEAFIVITGNAMPVWMFATMFVIVATLGSVAAVGVMRKVSESRTAQRTEPPSNEAFAGH